MYAAATRMLDPSRRHSGVSELSERALAQRATAIDRSTRRFKRCERPMMGLMKLDETAGRARCPFVRMVKGHGMVVELN